MRNLLKLKDLQIKDIEWILRTATQLKHGKRKIPKDLDSKIIANLFFESSTRTQYSFNTAELKLGCKQINFQPATSSINKGETLYDTIKTFDAFGLGVLVIRHAQDRWYDSVLGKIKTPLINAGDGKLDHPSQTLLDLMTIQEQFGKFKGLNILIVGDIAHSRVARSNKDAMERLGMKVFFAAPKEFQDSSYKYVDFDTYINKVDVINMLRIQNERLESKMRLSLFDYNKQYGLNISRVNKMKKNAIIIHPAPFNRNVEINDDIVECKQSRIFKQIENGVFVRMAMIM